MFKRKVVLGTIASICIFIAVAFYWIQLVLTSNSNEQSRKAKVTQITGRRTSQSDTETLQKHKRLHTNSMEYDNIIKAANLKTMETRSIPLRIKNNTQKLVRVLGFADLCTKQFCVAAANLPAAIETESSQTIWFAVSGKSHCGQFEEQVTLYTDCPGSFKVELTIRGNTIAR